MGIPSTEVVLTNFMYKSGWRDSNSQPHAPKARTLPIEPHPEKSISGSCGPGGTRTLKTLPSQHFKCCAYTNSATEPMLIFPSMCCL